jgi:hypothetical protein
MKKIKLRRVNSKKFCINCKELVEINMEREKGYCFFCGVCLYSIETQKPRRKKIAPFLNSNLKND